MKEKTEKKKKATLREECRQLCRSYKPGSVTATWATATKRRHNPSRPPVIYLRRCSHIASSNLPPDIGRATLNCRYTWSCNPRDVLPRCIATLAVGSYPAFSPLPFNGRLFSSTLLYPHEYQVVSLRGALCCSDFPPPLAWQR